MKALVKLKIETELEYSDNGYLGDTDSSIREHIDSAAAKAKRYEVWLKDPNNGQFEQCVGTVKLHSVVLTP